ncbi:hypothetical protein QRX60_17585 [Amycolatopsis mongoliensis]|uniref:Uncharacterized protein n=1 Tax=Amycolatopsis mongoliensis TaxID=715475 RepID=A0A9Y2NN62_9PSEU|nr:hypothetical protein [Amycolatopsis sp. 4-36]WIY05568.1 hypothetical protein QRX60_17585 [Amycolatopsis sp. 4-36]
MKSPSSHASEYVGPIWTLNARDNFLLRMTRSYFNLDSTSVRREIEAAHRETVDLLGRKGVKYMDLRAALVPKGDGAEVVFVFDSEVEYGPEPFRRVLQMLDQNHTCSILAGDLLGIPDDLARGLLENYVNWFRRPTLLHSSQLYGIYINNLTSTRLDALRRSVESMSCYVGFSDVTYSTPFKTWMSMTLPSCYVKLRNVFIAAHSDDLSDEENEDARGWVGEDRRCVSIADHYFELFLSFKIERQLSAGDREDVYLSLNGISDHPSGLSDLDIEITPEKLEYLQREKAASLGRAGLLELSVDEVRAQISGRMGSNYVYNLRYHLERGQSLFNIMLEFSHEDQRFKLMVALEYLPSIRTLRIITAF